LNHRLTETAGRSGCNTDPHNAEQLTFDSVNGTTVPSTDDGPVVHPPPPRAEDTEGQHMIGVEHFLASRNYAPTSLKQRRVILGQFVGAVGDPAVCDAEAFLDWWQTTERLAPASRRASLIAVRSLLEWLVDAGVRTDNPARLVRTPTVPRTPPKVLTPDEVTALRRAVTSTDDHLLIELQLTCGLRIAEVAALDHTDLHVDDELLVVHGKGARTAMIPVPSWLVETWPDGTGRLFDVGVPTLRRRVRRLFDAAGIDRRHGPHSLRRTCGTELARKGVPLHLVAGLLRHESVATTGRHYTATTLDDLRSAYR
jgi:site-specific recombinase XerD